MIQSMSKPRRASSETMRGGLASGGVCIANDSKPAAPYGIHPVAPIISIQISVLQNTPAASGWWHRSAFWAAVGCGAKIVAAVWAEAGAVTATRAEDGAETDRGRDGEEKSGEPVWEPDEA